jgi:small subunit ribosomal protein S6
MQYELFYLVGAAKEAELDKIKQEVAELVTSEGGVFEEKQVVEKRKMAYEVKHENRGFYVAQRFNLEDPEKIQDMTRKINLYTNILRFIITRTDELPELTSRAEREGGAKAKTQTETVAKPVASEVKEQPVAAKTEAAAPVVAPEAPVEETVAPEKAEEKSTKMDEEDIDKKLEEILNI